ncbi:MAG: carboxyl transferase domain-containing protein [Alphaproteobacteria bacterium]|jgi:geranyl-CoA carboxylase beta subunit|nr:acetyl-CoA carboxylase carboxyltransferase subunit [Rhodospirillaceae bacterium]MDP6022366.1 carboxyl transferase domain-containing protein [Alphaproteobacteria bacterium]MDP6254420.1 carboxyl transferase domain-containing protein [Alphaproteobacteria bacterium]MDP7053811.1 carboxyl transferase domain-containing protein [Alphaproteobacteria bacterium]MDP7228432.1 carboxyl transferase domain-containing protein [Alphaproteobacteria bacterium]|tara:strand:+ start:2287 stop:3909 length:1623 start_codon:yes stop_codon:yes gene_type:complete
MSVFASKLSINTDTFAANRQEMLSLMDDYYEIKDRARALSEKRRARFEERGQLTPRERRTRLLDPGMPFLELYSLANYCVDTSDREKSIPGASSLAGIGFISGIRCLVYVDDSGINAGASTQKSGEKLRACLDAALLHKLPFVHLVESAGANLMQYQVESWAHGGGIFYRRALLSAAGIPTITVLHGPATAGGAYMPGMSDYVISIKGRGRASLGGAALTRAATGEISDEEELAGTDMHATISGLVEYTAEDDAHGLLIARNLVAKLDWNKGCPAPKPKKFAEPRYSADEIAGLVPPDYRKPYEVRELVARFIDDSDFEDFKPRYGVSTVCLQASIYGNACGIIGNNGPIDPAGATKGGQFFQLCDQANIPIIFLNNTTGYMVGKEYEQGGMVKHGSKMIQAVSNVRVPKITLYIGASFGAGNYGMGGHGYEPEFLFTWPNALTGVMGGEQAANTMDQVARVSAERRGQEVDEAALKAQKDRLIAHFDSQSDAFYTSGRLLDQGMIDPRDTRRVLGFALETCWEARNRDLHPNAFGVARL